MPVSESGPRSTSGEAEERSWLRQIPYFRQLPDEDFKELRRCVHVRTFAPGEVIFLEGGDCPGLHMLVEGRVRIFKTSPSGKEQVLRMVQPVESFNDVPVFDGEPNPASADALEESHIALLPKSDAARLLRTRPAFAEGMLRVFAKRLRYLTTLVENLSFRHVRGRLALALVESAGDAKASRLTQRQLADMAGTAREVAGRALRQMEAEGFIRIARGRTEILDRRALQDLAAGGE